MGWLQGAVDGIAVGRFGGVEGGAACLGADVVAGGEVVVIAPINGCRPDFGVYFYVGANLEGAGVEGDGVAESEIAGVNLGEVVVVEGEIGRASCRERVYRLV
jgi:hypothetical protein